MIRHSFLIPQQDIENEKKLSVSRTKLHKTLMTYSVKWNSSEN